MKDKLLTLLYAYIIPLILGLFHGVTQKFKINGEEIGIIGNFFAGFTLGMMIEGMLMMTVFTFTLLFTNKLD